MKLTFLMAMFFYAGFVYAQQQSYDLINFAPPKGWKKQVFEDILMYSMTDNIKRTWAQISIVKSTTSKGTADADFESEWQNLGLGNYRKFGLSEQPIVTDTQTLHGWKVVSGMGNFIFNNDTCALILNTISDGNRCASFTLVSNTKIYGPVMDKFLESVSFKPVTNSSRSAITMENPVTSIPVSSGFQFNTTNFEDGWTSVVKEDWVEATKGNIKVLLHYPREEDKKYYSQYKEQVQVFWNLLVAPRYSNLRNYQSPDHLLTWQPGYFAAGLVTDKATGKDLWVALFSKGKSGWVEVIAPDKKTFVDNFGVDNPELYFDDWGRMLNLFGLNKFAVGENDLTGKWSDSFYGATAYYNTVTGMYAGTSSFASTVQFTFHKNKTFNWELGMGQTGINTTMKVDHAKASGTWKMLNNWQIWFSEIERKPKTYNAYFSCIKGGRILWLQDVEYGSYNAYGKISK
jgi:hypothetical protein